MDYAKKTNYYLLLNLSDHMQSLLFSTLVKLMKLIISFLGPLNNCFYVSGNILLQKDPFLEILFLFSNYGDLHSDNYLSTASMLYDKDTCHLT
jgi:hypothetical protein